MMNYGQQSFFDNFKYSLLEFYNKNKWLIFTVLILLILALLTGIFTSVKLFKMDSDIDLEKYSIYTLIEGDAYSFKYFLLRYVSVFLICGLLFVFSLTAWLYCFGFLLLIYRCFLVSLNCTFLLLKCSFSEFMFPLIVIFIAQILIMILLSMLFITFLNISKNKKRYKCIFPNEKRKVLYIIIAILLAVLIQTLLLLIFKPTTILII